MDSISVIHSSWHWVFCCLRLDWSDVINILLPQIWSDVITMRAYRHKHTKNFYIHTPHQGLAQDCGNSSALAMELWQSCAKPSMYINAKLLRQFYIRITDDVSRHFSSLVIFYLLIIQVIAFYRHKPDCAILFMVACSTACVTVRPLQLSSVHLA